MLLSADSSQQHMQQPKNQNGLARMLSLVNKLLEVS